MTLTYRVRICDSEDDAESLMAELAAEKWRVLAPTLSYTPDGSPRILISAYQSEKFAAKNAKGSAKDAAPKSIVPRYGRKKEIP